MKRRNGEDDGDRADLYDAQRETSAAPRLHVDDAHQA
jgi:hypothetical protein